MSEQPSSEAVEQAQKFIHDHTDIPQGLYGIQRIEDLYQVMADFAAAQCAERDRQLAAILYIVPFDEDGAENRQWEVPAEPEPQYFDTLEEAIKFHLELGEKESARLRHDLELSRAVANLSKVAAEAALGKLELLNQFYAANEDESRDETLERATSELVEAKLHAKCGLLNGMEKPFIGGCGELVSQKDAYRCSDCTAYFHRDCIREHFEVDEAIKNMRAKSCWRKDCAEEKKRGDEARDALRTIDAMVSCRAACEPQAKQHDHRCLKGIIERVLNDLGQQKDLGNGEPSKK